MVAVSYGPRIFEIVVLEWLGVFGTPLFSFRTHFSLAQFVYFCLSSRCALLPMPIAARDGWLLVLMFALAEDPIWESRKDYAE